MAREEWWKQSQELRSREKRVLLSEGVSHSHLIPRGRYLWILADLPKTETFCKEERILSTLKGHKERLEDGRTANTKVDWATIHTQSPEVYCKSDKASLRHSLCEQFQDSVELNPNISETIDSYFQFKYRKKSNRVSHMYT